MNRLDAFIKIAAEAGILTSYVSNKINSAAPITDFKTKFLNSKVGADREKLIYDALIAQGPPKNLVPVTVPAPNGGTITYHVMPDYVMIDGIRVPMSGQTAQKVADHFGMVLPTTKMSEQIYNAADTKIMPAPLSSGGTIAGKHYSGEEVVAHKIGDSDSSVAYNEMIDKDLAGKTPTLVAGHMKDIIQPFDPNKLGLYGWYNNGKPIQYSGHTPHDITEHTEYGAGTRLIDNNVTITNPDGTITNTTMDKVLLDPDMSKAVSETPGKLRRYNIGSKPS